VISLRDVLLVIGATPRDDRELRLAARAAAIVLATEPVFDRLQRSYLMAQVRGTLIHRWREIGHGPDRAHEDADLFASLVREHLMRGKG
jgi:hypothetical protein